MKKINKEVNKNSLVTVLVVSFVIALAGPIVALAAGPAPVDLLSAGDFLILSKTGITNTGSHTSVIAGNIGSSPITAAAMNNVFCSEISGIIYGVNAAYVGSGNQSCFAGNPPLANKTLVDNAVLDMETAYTDAAGRTDPIAELGAGNIGGMTLAPGLYKWSTNVTIPTNVTLSGSANDVWIFQIAGNLTIASGGSVPAGIKVVLAGGAKASNVFWQVGGVTGATLGTYSTFNGNILSAKQIIIQTGAVLNGRALAQTQVTLDANTISVTPEAPPLPSNNNTLTVFKQVINNNGGTSVSSDFPLFVNGNSVVSGQSMSLAPGMYTVTETSLPNYRTTFAGDCNANGQVNHGGINTHNDICTIINDDIGTVVAPIPPLVHVTKIPNPLVLPSGPGLVAYDYAVSNVGIVPMTNITVADNKCGSVNYISGDINLNSRLDISEIWHYRCIMTLTQTTKNTVTATGRANGLTATDIADAVVVVGSPLPPPLIDLVQIPTPFFLPSGGGLVKYTYLVNNPGTAPLSGVTLTDTKCTQIVGPSGDVNGNGLLDTNETWIYSCQKTLSATLISIGMVTGSANGLTVAHSSVVTVVVAAPTLPNTGFSPEGKSGMTLWNIVMLASILMLFSTPLVLVLKKRKI